jgi:hypothetical protein
MLFDKEERIDTTYGPKQKADALQMGSLLYGLAYVLLLGEGPKYMDDHHLQNMIFIGLTVVGAVIMLITGIHNTKKTNKAFSWSMWYSATGGMLFAAFLYHGRFW